MLVTLSTGEEVTLSDKWGRKAMRAYNLALGIKYEEQDDGNIMLDRDIPLENFNLAVDAALPHLVEKVKAGEIEQPFSPAWLDNLDSDDFLKLKDAVSAIKAKEARDKKK